MFSNNFVITNILDLDWYKLTMMQFVFRYYRSVKVKYGFTNRKKNIKLARIIDFEVLRNELENIKSLKFTEKDIQYLRGEFGSRVPKGFFFEEFLQFLTEFQMSDYHLSVDESGDQFIIEADGTWLEAILWETFILSTVNELFYRYYCGDDFLRLGRTGILESRGVPRLEEKIKRLKKYPHIKYV